MYVWSSSLYTTQPIDFLNITFMGVDFYTLILGGGGGGVGSKGTKFDWKSYLVIDVTIQL